MQTNCSWQLAHCVVQLEAVAAVGRVGRVGQKLPESQNYPSPAGRKPGDRRPRQRQRSVIAPLIKQKLPLACRAAARRQAQKPAGKERYRAAIREFCQGGDEGVDSTSSTTSAQEQGSREQARTLRISRLPGGSPATGAKARRQGAISRRYPGVLSRRRRGSGLLSSTEPTSADKARGSKRERSVISPNPPKGNAAGCRKHPNQAAHRSNCCAEVRP